ncbi:uncharacterized protein TRAVEDRAFT_48142 [Trametes versicolor FP-101664 SS1]|uniref:uncharacterized protein n=1 Tax=Trametes versicolor (strain FP-101664) TaxID=717944 RepID=UPI0004623F82|nr:uncharacterized protein TRAVEDRAFT_48142 [Trametes versicolor FP-101664 SS1]EIW59015.1 hypothetical protein TRAVEDRAFT_48142 [Trametes versicolor FP-101664 SS1]
MNQWQLLGGAQSASSYQFLSGEYNTPSAFPFTVNNGNSMNTGCSISDHAALSSELQAQRKMYAELKRDLGGLRRRLEVP